MLPGMPAFQDAAGNVKGLHIFGEVTLSLPSIIEIVLILAAAFLSFKTTDKRIRVRNHFTWGAIKEVAVLFHRYFYHHAADPDALNGSGTGLLLTRQPECSGRPEL